MDAYVFATSATSQAVSDLLSDVGTNGVRVVCPLSGDHDIYVAVEAANQSALESRVAAVTGTTGLSGASAFYVLSGDPNQQASFPTHAQVSEHLGFALLAPSGSASSLAGAAGGLAGVVGVAVVTGNKVLVEVTATTVGGVQSLLAAASALTGVASTTFTAVGEVDNGAGFQA